MHAEVEAAQKALEASQSHMAQELLRLKHDHEEEMQAKIQSGENVDSIKTELLALKVRLPLLPLFASRVQLSVPLRSLRRCAVAL